MLVLDRIKCGSCNKSVLVRQNDQVAFEYRVVDHYRAGEKRSKIFCSGSGTVFNVANLHATLPKHPVRHVAGLEYVENRVKSAELKYVHRMGKRTEWYIQTIDVDFMVAAYAISENIARALLEWGMEVEG